MNKTMPKVGDVITIKVIPSRERADLEEGKYQVKVTALSSFKDCFFGSIIGCPEYLFHVKEIIKFS